MNLNISDMQPVGYTYLLDKYNIDPPLHWHRSYISSSQHHSEIRDNTIIKVYPTVYYPGDAIGDHLEFALKYDGINLLYLSLLFNKINENELITYIRSKPTGKYARKIWFFYEFLKDKELDIPMIKTGNYVHALDPKKYYTIPNGVKIKRQRIIDNLIGNKQFCPIVRKTSKLKKADSTYIKEQCNNIITAYPSELLKRALSYLYKKETRSSYEIEHLTPSVSRAEKFIHLLESAERKDFCNKSDLIDLQSRIVDPRFSLSDYRNKQNYVGETVSYEKEIIHFISPKPSDTSSLMARLIQCHENMKNNSISPIIHAAVISYGFVFLHPFEDGNGRIHRFLLHNILSVQKLTPQGLMFPISATILKNPRDYDNSLESFSQPLNELIDYTINELGEMNVLSNTKHFYQYMDMTIQVEYLLDFIVKTLEIELVEELNFITSYDNTKKEIQNIIDMPDRLIDLFIKICINNSGNLSKRKRTAHFDFLTDEELRLLEHAVKKHYSL